MTLLLRHLNFLGRGKRHKSRRSVPRHHEVDASEYHGKLTLDDTRRRCAQCGCAEGAGDTEQSPRAFFSKDLVNPTSTGRSSLRAKCRSHDYIKGRTKWSKPPLLLGHGGCQRVRCVPVVFRHRVPAVSHPITRWQCGVVSGKVGDVRPNAASQQRDDCGTPFSRSRRQFLGLLRSHGRRRRRMMKTPFSPPRRKLTQTEANLGWQSEGLTHNSRISTSIDSLGAEN